MRSGIIEQLPKVLPKDKMVMIIGHDNIPSESLKRLISDLNREEKWIEAEFKSTISGITITSKFAVVLTMFGVNKGSLVRIRNSAKDICCPHQALTASEVKNILLVLSDVRSKVKLTPNNDSELFSTSNGHSDKTEINYDRVSPVEDSEVGEIAPAPATSSQNSVDISSALTILEKFNDIVGDTQVAVLLVADQLKSATAECDSLYEQLREKEREILSLKEKLTEAHKIARQCAELEDENKKLKSEVGRLKQTLDSFEAILKGVRGK